MHSSDWKCIWMQKCKIFKTHCKKPWNTLTLKPWLKYSIKKHDQIKFWKVQKRPETRNQYKVPNNLQRGPVIYIFSQTWCDIEEVSKNQRCLKPQTVYCKEKEEEFGWRIDIKLIERFDRKAKLCRCVFNAPSTGAYFQWRFPCIKARNRMYIRTQRYIITNPLGTW